MGASSSHENNQNEHGLADILAQGPEEVSAWIKDYTSSLKQNPNFLLSLAQAAVWRATSAEEIRREVALSWAATAVEAYELLAQNAEPEDKDSYLNSQMSLRVRMLNRYGTELDNAVLDIRDLFDWFFRSSEFSYQQARELALQWREALKNTGTPFNHIDRAKVLKLRQLKNRLKIIHDLRPHTIPLYPDLFNLGSLSEPGAKWSDPLERWLSLIEVLP